LKRGVENGGHDSTSAGERDWLVEVDSSSFVSGLSLISALEGFVSVDNTSKWEVDGAWNVSCIELFCTSGIENLVVS